MNNNTKAKPNNLIIKKRHPLIISVLLGIYVAIKTALVLYAVIFTVVSTVALYVGYKYFDKHVLGPIKEVKLLKTKNPDESAYMAQYREELKKNGESDTLFFKFMPLDSISKTLIAAVLAAEDDGFYMHPGVSLDAIVDAIEYNRSVNANKRGASTISQQLAKNLFLTPEKSFERKIKELGYTILMEKYLGKDRILELYLNYAQWGKNIFGCEAASIVYYKKSNLNLTLVESARMASCLAMPTKITPHYTKSGFMAKRVAVIANNMYLHRKIDDAGYLALTGEYPAGKEPIDIDEEVQP